MEVCRRVFLGGDLLSNCTKVMGLAPSPWNINSKILDEIAKPLQFFFKSG